MMLSLKLLLDYSNCRDQNNNIIIIYKGNNKIEYIYYTYIAQIFNFQMHYVQRIKQMYARIHVIELLVSQIGVGKLYYTSIILSIIVCHCV